jgi:Tol biopolymer transport system component
MNKSRVRLMIALVIMLLVLSLAAIVNAQSPGADDMWPVWSPDGKQIAFVSNRDGNKEIYVMNADGSKQRDISNTPYDDSKPQWSPDGQRLIYLSSVNGDGNLTLVDADGGSPFNLASEVTVYVNFPQWSPDSSHIAFISAINDSENLYVISPDGRSLLNLTKDIQHLDNSFRFQWSPDSEHIAFEIINDDGVPVKLLVADSTAQTPHSLLDDFWIANKLFCCLSNWIWSPDSQSIIFAIPNYDSLYRVNISGGKLEELVNVGGLVTDLAWSSGGQNIIYYVTVMGQSSPSNGSGIYQFSPSDKQIQPILPSFGHFIIAPDTSHLMAFSEQETAGVPNETVMINLATLESQNLDMVNTYGFGKAWSPDSHSMATSLCVEGNADIFRLDFSDTISVTNVTPNDTPINPDSFHSECTVTG